MGMAGYMPGQIDGENSLEQSILAHEEVFLEQGLPLVDIKY